MRAVALVLGLLLAFVASAPALSQEISATVIRDYLTAFKKQRESERNSILLQRQKVKADQRASLDYELKEVETRIKQATDTEQAMALAIRTGNQSHLQRLANPAAPIMNLSVGLDNGVNGQRNLRAGDWGRIFGETKVLQVLSSDSAIMTIEAGNYDCPPFLAKGFSMQGRADGQVLQFGLLMITGTHEYQSAMGAKRTIMVAEPIRVKAK